MGDQATQFGQLAAHALQTAGAASHGQLTRASNGSELQHKRAFLETFRRWEILFKRKDSGDTQAEKWLIAEYYDSLGHLSPEGLQALTRLLKENCTFFPSIKECLDLMRPKDQYDWGHPFRANPPHLFVNRRSQTALTAQAQPAQIGVRDDV